MRMILDGRGQYFPGDNSFPTLARQMDHDLRSPLTAICSYAECIAWLPNLEPEARELYARTILAEARRLGRLASSFLVLAAPSLSNDLDELELGVALDEALEEVQDVIQLQGFHIDWEKPAERSREIGVVWPHAVLQQLLVAAIEVAVEAGRASAYLKLQARDAGEQGVAVELSSTSCELSRAAESFAFRATEALARQRGGEVTLETGRSMRLALRLPRVGRVRGALEQEYLEKSA
jgi:signal transduction histidine kinase